MNYVKQMRSFIGHETLFTVGCGVIIESNEKNPPAASCRRR